MPAPTLMDLINSRNPGDSGLAVRVHERPIGTIPAGRTFRIEGTGRLSEEQWKELGASVAGAFTLSTRFGLLPITGNASEKYRTVAGRYPEPVFVSFAQYDPLSRYLGPSVPVPPKAVYEGPILGPKAIGGVEPAFVLATFQETAARRAIAEHRSIFAAPVGAGKTAAALAAAETLLADGTVDRVVVTVPRRLIRDPWLHEWERSYGERPTVVDGSPAERKAIYAAPRDPRRWLVKFDSFRLDAEHLIKLFGPKTFWVVDEVHYLKNPRTKRFKAAKRAVDSTETDRRLFLTGTIVYDRTLDIYGPIALLGFRVWSTYNEFTSRFYRFESYQTPNGWVEKPTTMIPGRVPELRTVLNTVAYIPTRDEVELELPPVRRGPEVDVTVELSKAEERAYEVLVTTPLQRELEIMGERVWTDTERNLLAILSLERSFSADPGTLLASESERAYAAIEEFGREEWQKLSPGTKLKRVLADLGEIAREDADTKVVIFTSFERTLGVLRSIRSSGRKTDEDGEEIDPGEVLARSVFFDGSLTEAAGAAVLESFKTDPNVRFLFSTDAGGVGINLQEVASRVIHVDDPLSLGQRAQREGRVWRRGQRKPVIIARYALGSSERLFARLGELLPGGSVVDARIRELLEVKESEKRRLLGTG